MLNPFRGFRDIQSEMNRMLAETLRRMPQMPTSESTGWTPVVDVVTKDNDMVIRAELPGMKREDVDVSLQNGVLTISGERKEEEEHKDAGYLVKERRYGSFRRSMTLPESIGEDKIRASFKDGLLEVTVEGAGMQVEGGPQRIAIES